MSPPRQHHLSIATAKHAFLHPARGVIFCSDPMPAGEASAHGLQPLVLYAVAVVGLPIIAIRFALQSRPTPVLTVLNDVWRNAPALRGRSTSLYVNRSLDDADAGFVRELIAHRVRVSIIPPRDKAASSVIRTAQLLARNLGYHQGHKGSLRTLADLNRLAAARDRQVDELTTADVAPELRAPLARWLELPPDLAEDIPPIGMDWKPGRWLAAWETRVPARLPRQWHQAASSAAAWLLPADDERDDVDLPVRINPFADCEGLRSIVSCWPGGLRAVATAIGVTHQELSWAWSGTQGLPRRAVGRLYELVGLTESERISGCVLVAQTLKHAREAFGELTRGGDLQYAVTVIPDAGTADPSWEYLLFAGYGDPPSVLLFPRSGQAITRLNSQHFINYAGQTSISARSYRDLTSVCGHACTNPPSARAEVIQFGRRNTNVLSDLAKRYSR